MWQEIFILIAGVFIGIALTIWAELFGSKKEQLKQNIKSKLPHKMASIEGLSDEEQSFADSLKSQTNKVE